MPTEPPICWATRLMMLASGISRCPRPTYAAPGRRDHGGAQAGAADEQRGHEQDLAGAGGDERERHGRRGDEGEGDGGDPAGPEAVDAGPRQASREERAGALRDEQETGAQRVVPADLLEVQRQQHHRAVQGEAAQEEQGGGGGDRTVAEQPQVDQGARGPGQRPGGEGGDQGESAEQRDEDMGGGDVRAALDPGEAVDECGGAGAQE
ncbi:hypothetical protein LUW74_20900 [Actinomadura madurae]|nr:hypothetical protein [Actinomadura madurae]URN05529.1 hypothetical protein LUW74_20900 [Actinomadura madurae]